MTYYANYLIFLLVLFPAYAWGHACELCNQVDCELRG